MVQTNKHSVSNQYIVITRPKSGEETFEEKLKSLGFNVFSFPTILIKESILTEEEEKNIRDLESFDWVIFTSRNGVIHFMNAIKKLHVNPLLLQKMKIAAVGPTTAEEVQKNNLQVTFIPSKYTTHDLGEEIAEIKNNKIILPRAQIASKELTKKLKAKGASVVEIPIYYTLYNSLSNQKFEKLVHSNSVRAITFTSPSTIEGMIRSLSDVETRGKVVNLPVFSIGPVTTEAAKKHGFKTIYTSKVHTIEGLVTLMQENLL